VVGLVTLAGSFLAAGCVVEKYSSDPNARIKNLLAAADKAPQAAEAPTPVCQPAPAKAATAPDLTFLPAEPLCLVTFRPADLMTKLGLTEPSNPLGLGVETAWKQIVGLSLRDVERCTVVMTAGDKTAPEGWCIILHTARPYSHSNVLKACVAQPKVVHAAGGKKIYVSAANGAAAHFADPRALLVATSEHALTRWLARTPGKVIQRKDLADILAGNHDLAAWAGPGALGDATKDLPAPLAGVKSATATVDVGKDFKIGLRVSCADGDAAASAARVARAGIDMLRGQLLTVLAMRDMAEFFPDGDLAPQNILESFPFPAELSKKMEEALNSAAVKTEGHDVVMTVTFPVDAVKLCATVAGLAGMTGGGVSLPFGQQTWVQGTTLPSGQYLKQPPQYLPANPPFPLKNELAQVQPANAPPAGAGIPLPPPPPPGTVGAPSTVPALPDVAPSTGFSQALPAPLPSTTPMLPAPILPAAPPPMSPITPVSARTAEDRLLGTAKSVPPGSAQVKIAELEDFSFKAEGVTFNNICLAEAADATAPGVSSLKVSACYRNPTRDRVGYCLMVVGRDEAGNVLWACNLDGAGEAKSVGVLRDDVHLMVPAGTLKQTVACSFRAVVIKAPAPARPAPSS
jgi:hypothetical protein